MSECNCTTPECTCGGTGSVIVKIDHEPVVKILKNRIAALEAANTKQAARIAEMEDEREKLEKVEPLCHIGMWALSDLDIGNIVGVSKAKEPDDMPLFARPVPARTLTDSDCDELAGKYYGPLEYISHDELVRFRKYSYAIEAWLKGGE